MATNAKKTTSTKSATKKVSETKDAVKVDNSQEIAALKQTVDALQQQNTMLMQMVLELKNNNNNNSTQKEPERNITIVHLRENMSGITTHIELSNLTIDLVKFGEERHLTLAQAEELAGKHRKFFEYGYIAFGPGCEDLATNFGLPTVKSYPYLTKDFMEKLHGMDSAALRDLYPKLSEAHKTFIIEYFKRKVAEGDPVFKNPTKIETLNSLSDGAMENILLDFKRERENAKAGK